MDSSRIFDLAAARCGYDPSTDAEAARHDHHVWDAAQKLQELDDAATFAIDHGDCEVPA